MFNLSSSSAPQRAPRGSSSRSPSPAQPNLGKNLNARAQVTHGRSEDPKTTVGAKPTTSSMFDLSKRARPANPHGFIPGARSRILSPPAQPAQTVQILPTETDGGRKRTISKEPRPKDESKQEVSVDDITRLIPIASQKIPIEQIRKLLEGYVALPKPLWKSQLVYRQHIRYTRIKDHAFVRGGFIIGFGKQRGKDTLTIANGFDPKVAGYYVWVIGIDAIETIFVKRESIKLDASAT